jgi:hypothetical protein
VSLTVGSVLILAAFSLLDTSTAQSTKVTERVDSTQRGRLALDEIMRQLRSQVCVGQGTPAIADGRDDSITFHTFMSEGEFRPRRHTIAYEPSSRSIVEYAYAPIGSGSSVSYPETPTSTRTLLSDAVLLEGQPLFEYYTWSSTGQVLPSVRLTTPLAQASLARVVRVVIRFQSEPSNRPGSRQSTPFDGEVYARTADPNAPGGPSRPACA